MRSGFTRSKVCYYYDFLRKVGYIIYVKTLNYSRKVSAIHSSPVIQAVTSATCFRYLNINVLKVRLKSVAFSYQTSDTFTVKYMYALYLFSWWDLQCACLIGEISCIEMFICINWLTEKKIVWKMYRPSANLVQFVSSITSIFFHTFINIISYPKKI